MHAASMPLSLPLTLTLTRCMPLASASPQHLPSQEGFLAAVKQKKLVLVNFYAPW